jgi:hypothetical protein
VKYVARSEHKGNQVECPEKAMWYLRRKLELLGKKAASEETNP